MKLKYNYGGEVREIPLTTDKPQGKRLAVRKNGQTWYAPLVSVTDSTASNFRLVFGGEVCALAEAPTLQPEIENILIAPPRVSVMQGQSATAIVSAEGNEAVAGLSYSLTNPPTWITISDDMILIRPSDNDLGEAIVEVIAKDTGSDASASAAFVAEARLRPIIESLSVIPPAVTVSQGSTSTAIVQAVANSAVGGLSYSLDGAPSWVSLDQDTIHIEPTTNDTGTSTVQVVAYDTNSSARADTDFVAKAQVKPEISSVGISVSGSYVYFNDVYYVNQGETATFTLQAGYNAAVTGIEYSLENAPSWMTLSGNQIICAPTTNDTDTATITVVARDTGSTAQCQQNVTLKPQPKPTVTSITNSTSSTAIYDNTAKERIVYFYAWHAEGSTQTPLDFKIKGVTFQEIYGVEFTDLRIIYPDQYRTDQPIGFMKRRQTGNRGVTIWVEEPSGAISRWGSVLEFTDPSRATPSLNPAQATLVTGTSGNQTVIIKATTNEKVSAYWKVSGYFPQNSTITPGQGFNTRSSLASLKVVYPKKDQKRSSTNYPVTLYATPTSDSWNTLSSTFTWVSLSSSNRYTYP